MIPAIMASNLRMTGISRSGNPSSARSPVDDVEVETAGSGQKRLRYSSDTFGGKNKIGGANLSNTSTLKVEVETAALVLVSTAVKLVSIIALSSVTLFPFDFFDFDTEDDDKDFFFFPPLIRVPFFFLV